MSFQTVKASVVLDDAYRFTDWDSDQLENRQKAMARTALSLALQEVWDAWWWEVLMTVTRVQLADNPDITEQFEAGRTNYLAATDTYVTSLAHHEPGEAIGQSAQWETCQPDAVARTVWSADTAYAAYDQFSYGGVDYQCYVTAPAGTVPTDTSYFLPLQNWVPIVPWTSAITGGHGPYGPVRMVSKYDPRRNRNPGSYELNVTDNGTEVLRLKTTHPYVWARRVTPVITGDDFSATAIYAATAASELVFDS